MLKRRPSSVFLVIAVLLPACTHMGTLNGAIPVDPGYSEMTVDLQGTRDPNVLQTPIAIPLPTVGFHLRLGLRPNVDMGVHVFPLGLGVDLRYRFLESNGWSFATQPGLSGLIMPIPTLQYGQLHVALPVRAEHALGKSWSFAFGPGVMTRQTFFATQTPELDSSAGTFEFYAGGGGRIWRDWPKLRLGISGDLYVDTMRATGLYGGLGFDLSFTNRGGKRAREKAGLEALGGAPSDSE